MTATPAELAAMWRALTLASRSERGVNPQVGAVILDGDEREIAFGWHRGAGTAHAEVDALRRLESPDAARGATVVVTLEPCNHSGRTGPCTQALIAAGVARVVYAVSDPGTDSAGGAETLRAAGIAVESHVLHSEGEALLQSWLTARRLGRPWVSVKWAQSLDGRAAAADGSSQWITGIAARADVHARRAQADAIVVGTGTVLADDPRLTARLPGGGIHAAQPRPIVIGKRPVPPESRVFQHPRTLTHYPTHDLVQVLGDLVTEGTHRVFVEGGPTLATAFVRARLVDELLTYLGPTLLGGPRHAIGDISVQTLDQAPRFTLTEVNRLGDDLLLISTRDESSSSCSPD